MSMTPLQIVFREQSYSSLHSGWSLARDHFRSYISDPCGVIFNFWGVVAYPCAVIAIHEVISGSAVADAEIGDSAGAEANRCATH